MATKEAVKHTPGPWRYENKIDKRADGYVRCEQTLPGAEFGVAVARVTGEGPEARANARLIAAAPEMLEALNLLVGELETSRPNEWRLMEFKRAAELAIAKAEGR